MNLMCANRHVTSPEQHRDGLLVTQVLLFNRKCSAIIRLRCLLLAVMISDALPRCIELWRCSAL